MYRREIKITAEGAARQAGKAAKLVSLVYLLCQLGMTVLQYLGSFLIDLMPTGSHISGALAAGARNTLLTFLIAFVILVVNQLLQAGCAHVALQIHRREPVQTNALLKGFQIPGRVIALELLRTLLLTAWCCVIFFPVSMLLPTSTPGSSLFQVQSTMLIALALVVLLVVSYRYWGATFILLEHPELTPWQCLRAATAMTKDHRMELFLLDLSLIPWKLLCVLTLNILMIWKMPYLAAVYAGAYEELDRQYRDQSEPSQEPQLPTWQLPPDQDQE